MGATTPPTPRPIRTASGGGRTHEVTNQPPPLVPYDVAGTDRALLDALRRVGEFELTDELATLGCRAGSMEVQQWAVEANANPPRLRTHDRYGHRIDEVDFHPSWHRLLGEGVGFGLGAAPHTDGDAHAHLRRAAGFYLWSQAEAGNGCPLSMTYAAVAALASDPDLAAEWTPLLSARTYDPGLRPPGTKAGCLAGMAMTEKQGGSDVRANTTTATPRGSSGEYGITGHKWFCSAPMNDVFLLLACAPGGLTCFVVPRVLHDATRNEFRIVRLKDKLGNRSNASAEIELEETTGLRLGPEGRGVATIIEMVAATRLDCILGSTALMRRAVAEAAWHAAHRSAFGQLLSDLPAMRNVLADLAIEQEAAIWLGVRLATAVDAGERALLRIALPVGKYLVCKRAPALVAEALECLGGNGYVEESGLPLLFRESPLNSIWEGSGTIQALDVLRALRRDPEVLDAWLSEVGPARAADPRLDRATNDVLRSLADDDEPEFRARRLAERLARILQGALLVRFAPAEVADAFCAARLDRDAGETFGTLPRGADTAAILRRATPDGVVAAPAD